MYDGMLWLFGSLDGVDDRANLTTIVISWVFRFVKNDVRCVFSQSRADEIVERGDSLHIFQYAPTCN